MSKTRNVCSNQSVNIKVIKPGLFSFRNWFLSSKGKEVTNQMLSKNAHLTLNAEELLMKNGIDLQQLRRIPKNRNNKVKKNFIVLSKGRKKSIKNDLEKGDFNLMQQNSVSKQAIDCKGSRESFNSLVIKSNNFRGCNINYIKRKNSTKSIVGIVSSKASIKVGLKSKNGNVSVYDSKNIFIKGFSQALVQRRTNKNGIVPIYLGKTKSIKKLNNPEEMLPNKSSHNMNKKSKLNTLNKNDETVFNKLKLGDTSGANHLTGATNDKIQNFNLKDSCPSKIFAQSAVPEKTKLAENPNIDPNILLLKFLESLSTTNGQNHKENSTAPMTGMQNIITCLQQSSNVKSRIANDKSKDIKIVPKRLHAGAISNEKKIYDKNASKLNIGYYSDNLYRTVREPKENGCEQTQLSKKGVFNVKHNDKLEKKERPHGNNKADSTKEEILQKFDNLVDTTSRAHTYMILPKRTKEQTTNQTKIKGPSKTVNNGESTLASQKFDNLVDTTLRAHTYMILPKRKSEEQTTNQTRIKGPSKTVNNGESTLASQKTEKPMEPLKILVEKNKSGLNKQLVNNDTTLNSFLKSLMDINLLPEGNVCKEVNQQKAEDQSKKEISTRTADRSEKDVCSIHIEQADCVKTNNPPEEEFRVQKSSQKLLKREPKLSITILVENGFADKQSDNEITINKSLESKNHSNIQEKIDHDVVTDQKNIAENLYDSPSVKQNSENIVCETVTKPQKTPVEGSGDNVNNFEEREKSLGTVSLEREKDEFGIAGVGYLNQERRKRFDAKMEDLASIKAHHDVIHFNLTSEAFSLINLNEHVASCYLSESSFNHNTNYGCSYKRNILTNKFKTQYKPVKRNFTNGHECSKSTKTLLATNINLPNINSDDYHDKQIMSNIDRYCNVSDNDGKETRNFRSRYLDQSDAISFNQCILNHGKNNFIEGCNENLADCSENTLLGSSSIKKTSNRHYVMLNQEPIIEESLENLISDGINCVDDKTNMDEVFLLKREDSKTSTKRFQKNYETEDNNQVPIIESNMEHFGCDSGTVTAPKSAPLCRKRMSPSLVELSSNCKITSAYFTRRWKSFPCIEKQLQRPSKTTQKLRKNENLSCLSDRKINLKSKTSTLPIVELSSMNFSEKIKCCPCIFAKVNTLDSFVRSRAEILLEKSGPQADKNPNISIVCDTCAIKLHSELKSANTVEEESNMHNLVEHILSDKLLDPESKVEENKIHEVRQGNQIKSGKPLDDTEIFLSCQRVTNLNEDLPNLDKQISCRYTCLPTLSDDSVFSEISEKAVSNSGLFSVTSSLNLSKDKTEGITQRDGNSGGKLSTFETSCDPPAILQQQEGGDGVFCKILEETPETCNPSKFREHRKINVNRENPHSCHPMDRSQEDIFLTCHNMRKMTRMRALKNTYNFAARDTMFSNFDQKDTHIIQRGQVYWNENKTSWIRKSPNKFHNPSRMVNYSNHYRNFNDGYDLMSRNGDSIFSSSFFNCPSSHR